MNIADMKATIAGQAQGIEVLQQENSQLRAALQRFVTAAKSWHDFHHGSETIQCDLLCECIAPGERALAGVPERHEEAAIAPPPAAFPDSADYGCTGCRSTPCICHELGNPR